MEPADDTFPLSEHLTEDGMQTTKNAAHLFFSFPFEHCGRLVLFPLPRGRSPNCREGLAVSVLYRALFGDYERPGTEPLAKTIAEY